MPIPLVVENPCAVPGLTMLQDVTGDTSVALGLIGTPAPPGTDLKAVHLAQAGNVSGDPLLTFTIDTVANASGSEPAGTYIYTAMKINGPDPAVPGDTSAVHYRGVRVVFTNPSTPTFESYVPGASNNGTVDGRFVDSSKPAEAGSNYDGPNGKITIVVKASDLTLAPGSVISGFVSASGTNSDPANIGIPSVSPLFDQMPDSLGYANTYVVADLNACGSLQTAVSRKKHGSDALTFDVPLLPLPNGVVGVEDRTGGSFGNHTLVLTFDRPVNGSSGLAAVTPNTASGAIKPGPDVNQLTVELGNVANAQHLVINLGGVTDAGTNALLGNLTIPMDVLLGDVNGDGKVLNGDVGLVKSQVNAPVSSANFREDVNADGNILNGDVGITKGQVSATLP